MQLDELAILRRAQVLSLCGLSNSALHRHMKAGTFPLPVQLSQRAIGWRTGEVRAWLVARDASQVARVATRKTSDKATPTRQAVLTQRAKDDAGR